MTASPAAWASATIACVVNGLYAGSPTPAVIGDPSLHVAESSFHPAGVVSATANVPGPRFVQLPVPSFAGGHEVGVDHDLVEPGGRRIADGLQISR